MSSINPPGHLNNNLIGEIKKLPEELFDGV
jgi:hypothetical protein